MLVVPNIFRPFPEVRAAMTTAGPASRPFGRNFSHAVGDDPDRVEENRRAVATELGFDPAKLAWQRQVHGDRIVRVEEGYRPGESDALVTDEPGRLLAASVADCVPVLLYAPERRAVGAVHSGWRGSARNIAGKTVDFLAEQFGASPEELLAWIGPSAGACCYEVGADVATAFNERHGREIGDGKYLFDNKGVVLAQLLRAGLRSERVEIDPRCTICDERFHSYRRDRERSGRMYALIGIAQSEGDV